MLSLFEVTRAAIDAVSKLLHAQLRGVGDQGDSASAEPVDDAAVLSQLGVAVRPVIASTLRALGYQDGDEVWVLKLWDKARTPTDLDVGETRVFACGDIAVALKMKRDGVVLSAKGAMVTITSNGEVQVTPASGRDLVLNTGSLKVARATDPVSCGTIAFSPGSGGASLTYNGTPVTGAVTITGTIDTGAGATHVKA